MTLFTLIREAVPAPRPADLLTDDHPLRGYPPAHPARFSGWLRAGAFILLMLAGVVVCTSIYFAIRGSFTASSNTETIMMELLPAILAYIVLILVMESRAHPYEILPRRLLGLVKGILLGLVLICLCIAILSIIGVYRVQSVNWHYNPWMDILMVGVAAGVSEEILFRGMLFRLVEEGLGSWGAIVISALVFGGLHIMNPGGSVLAGLAIVIEAGLLFAAVYILTRSLWWCIGLHLAWNVAEGPLFGSIVSGTGQGNSWLVSSWTGPTIFSGGDFGLEASIVPVVLMGALSIGLLVYAQRRGCLVAPIWVRKQALLALQPQAVLVPTDPVSTSGTPATGVIPEPTDPTPGPAK